ncbi:hypothetical protein ACFOZY_00830 [Chungangia koreensis]|uniref:Uncharacterized protein n=1 Tax=Chungangia koreensis TaxID=752657 RepID=A0ABV8X1W6_9LACT
MDLVVHLGNLVVDSEDLVVHFNNLVEDSEDLVVTCSSFKMHRSNARELYFLLDMI